jgi:Berberine and berberine like
MLAFALLTVISLVLMPPRVARRGAFGRHTSVLLRSLYPIVLGLGGSDEEDRRLGEAYRDNLTHLAEVKASYDPDNLCRGNRNIAPAGSVGIGAD